VVICSIMSSKRSKKTTIRSRFTKIFEKASF